MDVRTTLLRFGTFEVDLECGELRKQGVRIKLQEQPFQALLALIERPREVLTREELQKRLWPPGTVVDFERGLNKVINRVREALKDDADNPLFIETLPLRGYRFLADVESLTGQGNVLARPPTPAPESTVETVLGPATARYPVSRRTVIAVAGGVLAIPTLYTGYRFIFPRQLRIGSIAVLPLENLSGDRAQEYFSDGMTDEIIGEIARNSSLRVISRTSVMQYKGNSRKSLPEIARELNVGAILEGTVLQAAGRVRITAQLIRASDDQHLWSERYESDLGDVLSLQSKVARAVAGEIQAQLTPQQTSPARTRVVNPAAYRAFLKGNFYLRKGLPGINKSIEFFKEAIRIDASHAQSYSGLAQALCFEGIFGFRPSAETYPEARRAALKGLELDDSNADAHTALADVKQGYDWDLRGAEAEFKRSLQLNPSQLVTRWWYAECLSRMKRYDESIAQSAQALELDPVSAATLTNRAMILFRARRYDESIQASRQALELDPNIINAVWWQGVSYAGKGNYPVAVACLTTAITMNDGPLFRALLGYVHGLAGHRAKALASLDELTAMDRKRFVSPIDFAIVCAGMGDVHGAFQWLESAYKARSVRILELPSLYFDKLRPDPRYADLLRRIGLS